MADERIDPALNRLEDQFPLMVEELAGLVAIDTSFPPGAGYGAFADYLDERLAPLGFAAERIDVPERLWKSPGAHGPRTNVIARRKGDGPSHNIYFHTDTVSPGTGWTSPPFALTRKDGKLFGRGTADMKGTIAATLGAIRALDQSGAGYAYDPVLLFCTDEEGGLYPGIRHLAESGRIAGPILCLNGQAAPRIWAGCFGSFDLRLRLLGRAAHSGAPGDGVNAIEEAIPVLAGLRALKQSVEARNSALPPPPGRDAGPLHARLSVTAAHGGDKGSSLPGIFEINVNRRYMPEEDEEAVLDEVRYAVEAAVSETRLLDWSMTVQGHLAPVENPRGEALWPRWIDALSRGFGWPVDQFQAWGSSTSSDMGWVQRTGQQEILLGGLGRSDRNVHAADEHTTPEDLMGLARSILFYLAKDFNRLTKTRSMK